MLPPRGKGAIPASEQVSVKPMENKILFSILQIVLCENSLQFFFLTLQKTGQAIKILALWLLPKILLFLKSRREQLY